MKPRLSISAAAPQVMNARPTKIWKCPRRRMSGHMIVHRISDSKASGRATRSQIRPVARPREPIATAPRTTRVAVMSVLHTKITGVRRRRSCLSGERRMGSGEWGLVEANAELGDERQVVRGDQGPSRPCELQLHHFDVALVVDV